MGAKEPNPSPNRHNKNSVKKPPASLAPPPRNRKLSIDGKPPISPAPPEDYGINNNDLLERIEWLENRVGELERKFENHTEKQIWLNL